jgi:hypothetical protein
VSTGTIAINYSGSQANANLNGKILALTPKVSANGGVIWNCGYKAVVGSDPTGSTAGSVTTTVLPKYLPQNCRT